MHPSSSSQLSLSAVPTWSKVASASAATMAFTPLMTFTKTSCNSSLVIKANSLIHSRETSQAPTIQVARVARADPTRPNPATVKAEAAAQATQMEIAGKQLPIIHTHSWPSFTNLISKLIFIIVVRKTNHQWIPTSNRSCPEYAT